VLDRSSHGWLIELMACEQRPDLLIAGKGEEDIARVDLRATVVERPCSCHHQHRIWWGIYMPKGGSATKTLVASFAHPLYDDLAPGVPREVGIGPRMNVRLASATLAFQRALLESGVEPRYAIALNADCAWAIYEKWGRLARRVARLRTHEPADQMRLCIDGFLRFPFSQPERSVRRRLVQPGLRPSRAVGRRTQTHQDARGGRRAL
jgi:hypothetical protein